MSLVQKYETEARRSDVPDEYIVFLNNIRRDEGGELHRNSNEEDITTGSGIYKADHQDAEIFKYIAAVADEKIGISRPTDQWSDHDIERVNQELDEITLDHLAYEFYSSYLKGAMIHMFPTGELVNAMTNMYTNSPKGAWMAVQQMIKIANERGITNIIPSNVSSIDGLPGRKTKIGLEAISKLSEGYLEACRMYMIFGMTLYYIDLSTDDMDTSSPEADRHLRYLKGWTHNRMYNLALGH